MSSFNYSLDNVGSRLGVVESTGDRVTWTYDDSYQLTREQRAGATSYDTTFIYDAVGNRTLQVDSGARTTYSYDAANQLITENSGTVMTYTFDGDGNLASRLTGGNPSLTITWDYEDRLTAFTIQDVPLTYTADYDPDYRRVRHRTVAPGVDVTTRSLWDQENVLATMNDSAAIEKLFTYEPALYGHLISQRQGGLSYYFHFDGLGSTSQITDALQAIQNTYIYRAFGDTANSTGSIDTPFRFVGQQGYASDLDFLPYVRHRYLATSLGRWMSRDPLGNSGSEGNMYRYVEGRPSLQVDPSGLLAKPPLNPAGIAICVLVFIGGKVVQWCFPPAPAPQPEPRCKDHPVCKTHYDECLKTRPPRPNNCWDCLLLCNGRGGTWRGNPTTDCNYLNWPL